MRLANSNVLSDRLSQAIVYGELYGHRVWLVFVDLDRCKFVNDELGHNAGAQLLKEVTPWASRLLLVKLILMHARKATNSF